MPTTQTSTLLLTLLLAIGLVFFLRAASKDRTTVVEVHSPRPALEVMEGLCTWLESRGWIRDGGDAERCLLEYRGRVASSNPLAVLLSILGGVGAGCLGLVLRELNPSLSWWPLSLILLGHVLLYSQHFLNHYAYHLLEHIFDWMLRLCILVFYNQGKNL